MTAPNRASRRSLRQRPVGCQSGQALVIALGLLLAGGAMLHAMFSAGQVAAAKQRLTDTADAAAWSAGAWRARVLNYHAYSNRAILVNEVAIAQAVTLVSWARYFDSLARNATLLAPLLPPAEPVLAGVAQAATLARESAELAAQMEVPARGAETLGYKSILQASQEILHLSTQGFGVNMVAAEVARATDPSFFAWVLPDAGRHWQSFTRRGETLEDRRAFADLVVGSLDRFVAGPRSEDIRTPIPSPCLNLMRLRKRGATTLSETLDRWQSADTMSFHLRTLRGLRCRETESLPIGWGAAEAGEAWRAVVGSAGEIDLNPQANALAAATMPSFPNYSGIESTRELDHVALGHARFPTAGLAVIARQPGGAVATSLSRELAAGRMLPPDAFPGSSQLWALAASEVYFRRPAGAPARVEYASLFNPYWQVRLVAPTDAQRATAMAYVR